jgi:hypothetical protein
MRTLPIQFPCSKSLFGPATLRSNSTLDYASNVALYPKFQDYFRSKRPPLLAVWGKDDPFFLLPGAEAFKHDNRNAELYLHHFALETRAVGCRGNALRRLLLSHQPSYHP